MKKTMYILNYPGKGGTEKYVLDLIKANGADHSILVYSEDGPGLSLFKRLKVKTFQVTMDGPFDIGAARKVRDIAKKEQIGVIHAQFLRENYISLLAKLLGASVRVFWTYHVNVPMNFIIRSINKIVTRMNEKVITVSKFMYEELKQKGVPDSKLTLIYNGVSQPEKPFFLDVNKETAVISVIGRLREEKGQDFLLRSLALLFKLQPSLSWECHIYGEGPQHDELVTLVKSLNLEGRILFKGFSSDKDNIYSTSDIVVIPSSNEALSYVAIEAMAYGRAVIATNVGGLPEVVKHGETGLLVEYGNEKELANALKGLLENRQTMGYLADNGKRFFKENFTIEKMADQTLELYNNKN